VEVLNVVKDYLECGHEIVPNLFVVPNEVTWKQLLYFWIRVRKYLESVLIPETNVLNGSGGGTNDVN